MPSPIGHALAGTGLAWAGVPDRPLIGRVVWTSAVLAALADADLIVPHSHRAYTHSVGAVAVMSIITAVVTRWVTPRDAVRLTLLLTAAYASHLLLDWMAADDSFPYGIRAFWPFSDKWVISGWNIFPGTARRHLFSTATVETNVRAVIHEVAILGPIDALILVARIFNGFRHRATGC